MGQIFISYAREDQDLARPLAEALAARGWLLWWDPEIRFGDSFRTTIEEALEHADCVIVLWSRHSVESEWVRAEATKARKRGVLLPIFLDKVEPPLPFGEIQGPDFTRWSGVGPVPGLRKLVKDIERFAGPPTPPDGEDEHWEDVEGQEPPEKRKLVILYAHDDRDFLKKPKSTKPGDFLKFMTMAAQETGLELWWDEDMEHPDWDTDVEQVLDEASVVLLVVSISFLLSGYAMNRRAWRAYRRLLHQGTVVIAVHYQAIPTHNYVWLEDMKREPVDRKPIFGRPRHPLYNQLHTRILEELLGRKKPVRHYSSSRTLRLVAPSELSDQELADLRGLACGEAKRFVPDSAIRQGICSEARKLKAANGGLPLSKEQLAALDHKFLARKEKRSPDPKKIRWVLRCCGLHPQARVRVRAVAAAA